MLSKGTSIMKTHITTSGQLGPFLKHLRAQRGLSQAGLGKKIGLSQERISRIENHPEAVTFDQILTVLMALEATLTVEPQRSLSGHASASDERTTDKKDMW
jgi:HTH-type transcriptional regulator / antitoxin HipB